MAPPRPSTFWCLVLVLAILELAATAVYETDDAIIIDLEAPSEKASSSNSNNVANSADTSGTRTSRSLASTNEVVFTRQFGAGTWPPVLPVGPCFTSRGILGRCTSFRQCYPYFKLPELNNWETWILGMYDTCSYFNSNGRQAFGVCCSNPTFPSTPRPGQPARPTPPPVVEAPEPPVVTEASVVATEAPFKPPQPAQPINPSQGAIPPNWPPPIPTHPPDHTIPPLPTHPPSPGWPGLPQPVPTQPVAPPQAPTTTLAPARPPPPQPPTAPAFPWPPPIPTHPAPAPPRPTPPRPTAPTHPAFPVTQPPAAPTQPPTAAAPGTGAILADASCGISDSPRIVGGVQAEPGEFPWIAALFNGGRQFCGGSLIDSTHILTAAHCIAHMTSWDVSRLTVHLGDHNIKTSTETQHVTRKVKRLVRHKGFDSRTLYNDIAILTLDSPVTFTTAIRPICLPSGSALYNGKEATVTGWGSLRESGPQPAVLQKVTIPIWTNTECRSKYGNAAPGGIVEHFVCAGRAGRDSCSGDSGGPLMVNEGRWTQVGVVSWGIGCGKGQYPGVYTRVTHFLPWIQKNLS